MITSAVVDVLNTFERQETENTELSFPSIAKLKGQPCTTLPWSKEESIPMGLVCIAKHESTR